MKIDFEGAKLYVRPGATDLRKGITGLLAIIEKEMRLSAKDQKIREQQAEIKTNPRTFLARNM